MNKINYNNKIRMVILIIALIIIILTYILINYINNANTNTTTAEPFIVIYDDINDYLKRNVDKNILRDSYCFDNDKLLGEIKGNSNLTCGTHYGKVADIHYKHTGPVTGNEEQKLKDNIFYNDKTGKVYSFAELCPITTKQLNSTLCLRKHNNDISDAIYRLDNIVDNAKIQVNDTIENTESEVDTYRNDKYRLYNSTNVQDYLANN
jgi:hypothetical protein